MDIKHVLSLQPAAPGLRRRRRRTRRGAAPLRLGRLRRRAGRDRPRRRRLRLRQRGPAPPACCCRRSGSPTGSVTNGEWLAFMADGGYQRPELWLSDGWATGQGRGLATRRSTGARTTAAGSSFTLARHAAGRPRPPGRATSATTRPTPSPAGPAPGCRPRPSGSTRLAAGADGRARTPTGAVLPPAGGYGRAGTRPPTAARRRVGVDRVGLPALPRLPPAAGAVGEYNGKFMSTRWCCAAAPALTPPGHARPTYRNFFPPAARWPSAASGWPRRGGGR